jgi:hypothetical protein
MPKRFKVGDHVSWNSEAGRVRVRIVKTDHVAMHKGTALRLMRR